MRVLFVGRHPDQYAAIWRKLGLQGVDEGTASAGEYFPQLLQHYERAIVVGEHGTEGAGGAVEQAAMPGGITFLFTKGRSFFAGTSELNLEAKGVTLDVRVSVTEESEQAKLAGCIFTGPWQPAPM